MKQTSQLLDNSTVRLDKWLWAARFFKTRALAKQAIEGGKVHLNGQRCKPGKLLICDAMLDISRGYDRYSVVVIALANRRGPAKVAQTLYSETQESILARQKATELRRVQHSAEGLSKGRPDKRQRRKIHQFKQSHNS